MTRIVTANKIWVHYYYINLTQSKSRCSGIKKVQKKKNKVSHLATKIMTMIFWVISLGYSNQLRASIVAHSWKCIVEMHIFSTIAVPNWLRRSRILWRVNLKNLNHSQTNYSHHSLIRDVCVILRFLFQGFSELKTHS